MTDAEAPQVSIVIPVRNEVDGIAHVLDACLAQTYAGPIEVIVADGMSDDGTRDLLERYASRGVRMVDNPARRTPAGLNTAIAVAHGDVIVRCDGHSVIPPGYVDEAVRTLFATGAANVGGIQRAVGHTPMQRGIARAMTNPVGVGDARFHRGGEAGPTDTVYLGVFPKRVLNEIGGFDEHLDRNQDYELNVRLRDAGHTVWFTPTLSVAYTPRSTLVDLWRQYFAYGRWKRRVVRMHPGSLRLRQAAPPALVIVLAGSTVMIMTPLRPIAAAVLIGYGAVIGSAAVFEMLATKDVAALLSGPAIATMHVAWGTGFLIGRR